MYNSGPFCSYLERLFSVLSRDDGSELVAAALHRQVDERTDAVALHQHVQRRCRRLDLERLLELGAAVRTEADEHGV